MSRKYYYSPLKQSNQHFASNKSEESDYKVRDNTNYVNSPYVMGKLRKASLASRVQLSILVHTYMAIGNASHAFCTTIAQKKLAQNTMASVKTIQRAVRELRRAGLIKVYHRYKGEGITRRRTTSLMVLCAFSDFCRMNKDRIIEKVNNRKSLIGKISAKLSGSHQVDTEIISRDTGEILQYYVGACT